MTVPVAIGFMEEDQSSWVYELDMEQDTGEVNPLGWRRSDAEEPFEYLDQDEALLLGVIPIEETRDDEGDDNELVEAA